MNVQTPEDTSVVDRMRSFSEYLDDRHAQADATIKDAKGFEQRTLLKIERAEINTIRLEFQQLFEHELLEK